jgi:GDPmannose 4,6-dehydratase
MRGREFVTRKITSRFAELYTGKTNDPVELGNLNARRDWGFAGDYVEIMWKMLQHDKPDVYVVSSDETHTIREFAEETGVTCGFDLRWEGCDEHEIGYDRNTGKILVKVNPKYYRPAEVDLLLGNSEKARKVLGWEAKVNFKSLCRMMMTADIERAKTG